VQIDAQQGQSRVVGAHGFITAPDILALLCQLDADAVLDGLAGANRPDVSASVPAPNVGRNRYERRIARRVGHKDLRPDLRLSMQGASHVELVNISETGVLVETSTRAIIGSVEDLFISSERRCRVVRARTVRSSVVAIESGSLVYRTAFQFEAPLSLSNLLRN
jgi:hypothetical protein